jgi:hypothetical protein
MEKLTPKYHEVSSDVGARTEDLGTGTFTPCHNGIRHAKMNIPAGGELFEDYGDGWH